MSTKPANTQVIRMKGVSQKISLRPSTVYEQIACGKFPAPFKLVPGGRASGWLISTIDAWLEERAASAGVLESKPSHQNTATAKPVPINQQTSPTSKTIPLGYKVALLETEAKLLAMETKLAALEPQDDYHGGVK